MERAGRSGGRRRLSLWRKKAMCTNALSALEFDAQTAKRAQWEAFSFDLEAPGIVTVRNGSYADPGEHEYHVNDEGGVPVVCECPADTYQDGACNTDG